MGACMSSDANGTADERARNKAIEKELREVRFLRVLNLLVKSTNQLLIIILIGKGKGDKDCSNIIARRWR